MDGRHFDELVRRVTSGAATGLTPPDVGPYFALAVIHSRMFGVLYYQ